MHSTHKQSNVIIHYAFLHGYNSSPLAKKGLMFAQEFKEKFKIDLICPDLNIPSFPELTFTNALSSLDAMYENLASKAPWNTKIKFCLIGSSMGGYLSCRWAQLHPERVESLFLLCPAFHFVENTKNAIFGGEEAFVKWKQQGYLEVKDFTDKPAKLHWKFVEDIQTHPLVPTVPNQIPVHIVHGTKDVIIPIQFSRDFVKNNHNATLTEVDDGHDLMKSMPFILQLATQHFRLGHIHENHSVSAANNNTSGSVSDFLRENRTVVVGSVVVALSAIILINVLRKK